MGARLGQEDLVTHDVMEAREDVLAHRIESRLQPLQLLSGILNNKRCLLSRVDLLL